MSLSVLLVRIHSDQNLFAGSGSVMNSKWNKDPASETSKALKQTKICFIMHEDTKKVQKWQQKNLKIDAGSE